MTKKTKLSKGVTISPFRNPEQPGVYLVKPDKLSEATWVTEVFLRFNNKCGNCGSPEHLAVRLIVPIEAGGKEVATNGIILCRTCDLATGRQPKPGALSYPYPYNFYVSQKLHDFVDAQAARFTGKAEFLRQLIEVFLCDPQRYHDVLSYQDSAVDAKINFHMPSEQFHRFRAKAVEMGSNVTELLRGLLLFLQDQQGKANG